MSQRIEFDFAGTLAQTVGLFPSPLFLPGKSFLNSSLPMKTLFYNKNLGKLIPSLPRKQKIPQQTDVRLLQESNLLVIRIDQPTRFIVKEYYLL